MAKSTRKINLMGKHTYMISLPIEFVRKNNLKKGDELQSFIKENDIIFSFDKKIKKRNNNKYRFV